LRQTPYDTAEAARLISGSGYESASQWADDYVLQHASDTEALAAFTEIAKAQAAR
jgi:hypothetical protein